MIDVNKIAEHYAEIMTLLNNPPINPDNKDTPLRVAKSLAYFHGQNEVPKLTAFPFSGKNQIVYINDIEFSSLCAHHHLPFLGYVNIEYIPKDKILGLSKFPRYIEYLSKKSPTTQEVFTEIIYEELCSILDTDKVNVKVVSTVHTCCKARGAKSNLETVTEIKSF